MRCWRFVCIVLFRAVLLCFASVCGCESLLLMRSLMVAHDWGCISNWRMMCCFDVVFRRLDLLCCDFIWFVLCCYVMLCVVVLVCW